MTHREPPKPAELVAFEWRSLKGAAFEQMWVSGGDDRAWVLFGEDGAPYRPLVSETALFRNFAHLDGSRDAFERFAERYGRLGLYREHERELEEALHPEWEELEEEEGYWCREHAMLALAVALWDALQTDQFSTVVGNLVHIERPHAHFASGPLVPSEARAYAKTGVKVRDERDAVRKLLAILVSGALVTREVAPALVVSPSGVSPLHLTYGVETLVAAMWLQLAFAINGNRTYETCPVCGDEWESTWARSDKKYCSAKCRKSANRLNAHQLSEDDSNEGGNGE